MRTTWAIFMGSFSGFIFASSREHEDNKMSTTSQQCSIKERGIPRLSRASNAITEERVPPALSPAKQSRLTPGSPLAAKTGLLLHEIHCRAVRCGKIHRLVAKKDKQARRLAYYRHKHLEFAPGKGIQATNGTPLTLQSTARPERICGTEDGNRVRSCA